MMLQMLGVFAEFEHATIVDRVTAGLERRVREGKWMSGRSPYGYTRDKDTKLLVPDEVMRNSIAHAPQFIVDVQHCTARIPKDRIDALMHEGFHQDLGAARKFLIQARWRRAVRRRRNLLFSNHFGHFNRRVWSSDFSRPAHRKRRLKSVLQTLLWEQRLSHQVPINAFGSAASIGDGPNDQGLSTRHVARGKNFRHARHFIFVNDDGPTLVD